MRKTLFALIVAAGTFSVLGGSPASALSPAPLAPITDVAKTDGALTKVHWHHRHRHWGPHWGWGWGHYRPYRPYRPYYYYPHRRCWWTYYGKRRCRYYY